MKTIDILRDIFMFAVLVLLQVLILNRISLFDLSIPVLYIYFIIKLPIGRSEFYVILSAFLLGMIIDIFLNTPGVNAAATTIVATVRPFVLFLFYSKNESDTMMPSIKLNRLVFMKYVLTMVVMHLTLLFLIDGVAFFNLKLVVLRIASSSILTFILIMAVDLLFYRKGRVIG